MSFRTKWTHTPIELTPEGCKILDQEIAHIFDEIESAKDLIYHVVFLTSSFNGPMIVVSGSDESDDTVFLTYYETPEWTTVTGDDGEEYLDPYPYKDKK